MYEKINRTSLIFYANNNTLGQKIKIEEYVQNVIIIEQGMPQGFYIDKMKKEHGIENIRKKVDKKGRKNVQ